jgi:hypothetical protein
MAFENTRKFSKLHQCAQNVTLHIKMLDEEKSKHAGLFQQNGLSQFFST